MPQVEQNMAREGENWGLGLERFGFSFTDYAAQKWFDQNTLPADFSAAALNGTGAPNTAVALLRDIARVPLQKGMLVYPSERVVSGLAYSGFNRRKSGITVERTDDGRTTNHILALKMFGIEGSIEVVANDAWGLGWRLSEDHPLVKAHPQLALVQNPDISQKPDHQSVRSTYIDPGELAKVSRSRGMHANLLIRDFRQLFELITTDGNMTVDAVNFNGLKFQIDDRWDAVSMHIGNELKVEFRLGNALGTKKVAVTVNSDDKSPLFETARKVAAQIDTYNNF